MKNLNPEQSAQWTWNIRKIYLFHFLINFHLISGVLIPFFTTWGRLSFFQLMCLESYFTVMILLFEIPCGAISDYISRRFSIFLAGLANAIAVVIYASYPHILLFALGETLWAFSAALISGTDQALIYDSLKKMEKKNQINSKMATLQSALLAGIAISAPIGSMLGHLISLPFVMFIMVIPFSLATFVALTLKEPNKTLIKTQPKRYSEVISSGFKELTQKKELRILGFEYLSVEIVAFFLFWMYQPYLEQLQINLAYYGFVASAMTVSQLILTKLAPKLDLMSKNKKLLIQFYTFIPGIAFVLMALIQIPLISVFLVLIVVGFGFSRRIFFIEAINTRIGSDERATVLSTINMFSSLVRAIFYPFVGYFVMWSLNCTFIILGIIIILDAVAFVRIKNEYFEFN